MSRPQRTPFWQLALSKTRERLQEPLGWYPYPALISCGLVMILIGHLIPGLNPRLGSRADVIDLTAPRVSDGVIWIGVFSENDQIIATTSDRERFEWPLTATSQDLHLFRRYLEKRRRKEALAAGLANQTSFDKTSVLLSVDQRLKFTHIRPILNALAEAGIGKYAFETKLIAAAKAPHNKAL